MNEMKHEFPKSIGRPATSALLNANITTLKLVARMTDKELLAIHGVGPKAVRILRELNTSASTNKINKKT